MTVKKKRKSDGSFETRQVFAENIEDNKAFGAVQVISEVYEVDKRSRQGNWSLIEQLVSIVSGLFLPCTSGDSKVHGRKAESGGISL